MLKRHLYSIFLWKKGRERMRKEDKEYVRDEYGDIVREKKNVPILPCLKLVMDHVPPEKLKFYELGDAFSATKGIFINEHITKEIFSLYIYQYVLPKVADECPELKQALAPREDGLMSDAQIAYWQEELPENFDRDLYLAKNATEMLLYNRHVPDKRRKEILKKFEEVALSPNTDLK